MKYAALVFALFLAGCSSTSRTPPVQLWPDMKQQGKFKAQQENPFFADGRASRPAVPGTVARGSIVEAGAARPAVTTELMARGQERFNVYCAPCHDRTGMGQGIVGTRASWLATNLTEQRIREMTDEKVHEIITNGVRSMPSYRFQVGERDRWAIVAYVRALQRAASGTLDDVPQELRSEVR